MIRRTLIYAANFLRNLAPAAAGTGDTLTGAEVDMQGYTSLMVIAVLGAVTATGTATLTAKNSDVSATYGAGTIDTLTQADGTALSALGTTGDSNKLLVLEIHRPPKRYVRPQLVRATANVVVESIIAIPFNPVNKPTTLSGTAAAGSAVGANPAVSLV